MTSKKRITLLAVALLLFMAAPSLSQVIPSREYRELTAKPEEIISISSSVPFDEAIQLLNDMSKEHLGKPIITTLEIKDPIGVSINRVYWLNALELIVKNHGLEYKEYPKYIMITEPKDQQLSEAELSAQELYNTREVVISAVFFEADVNKLRQLGSSIKFKNDNGDLVADFTAADQNPGLVQVNFFRDLDFANIAAIFKALESRQTGEILASPRITVRSDKEGQIQIGSDFSITTQDFAGNTITQFFSTGSIIKVTPKIVTVDTTTFIHLDLDVQRSNAASSELGIEVKKTSAITSILLLDGEETTIGGLYTNEETLKREGVPLLKDLPWWFFGLRYIFGFESHQVIRKELIILLQADLVPSLEERIKERLENMNEKKNMLEEGLKTNEAKLEDYLQQKSILDEK